jgi:hypothetical protein
MRPTLTLLDFSPTCTSWLGPNYCIPFDDHKIVVSDDLSCADEVGRELLGLEKGSVGYLEINNGLNGGLQGCSMGASSLSIKKSKNPIIMSRAPPKWWFHFQEGTQKRYHALPKEFSHRMGELVYPITRSLNKYIVRAFK